MTVTQSALLTCIWLKHKEKRVSVLPLYLRIEHRDINITGFMSPRRLRLPDKIQDT